MILRLSLQNPGLPDAPDRDPSRNFRIWRTEGVGEWRFDFGSWGFRRRNCNARCFEKSQVESAY